MVVNNLINWVLDNCRNIAVVGCSRDPSRPAHFVPKYLQEAGYRIIPVNPKAEGKILNETVYPSLKDVPGPIDLVLIFRPAEETPAIVEEAVRCGGRAIWMQEGIAHQGAAAQAEAAGLPVVMDRCIMKEHQRWSPA